MACRACGTLAILHTSPCSGEALTLPVRHACGCASPICARFWSMRYTGYIPYCCFISAVTASFFAAWCHFNPSIVPPSICVSDQYLSHYGPPSAFHCLLQLQPFANWRCVCVFVSQRPHMQRTSRLPVKASCCSRTLTRRCRSMSQLSSPSP